MEGHPNLLIYLKIVVYGDLPSPLKIREKWSAFYCLGLMSFKAQLSILTRSILDFIKNKFLIFFYVVIIACFFFAKTVLAVGFYQIWNLEMITNFSLASRLFITCLWMWLGPLLDVYCNMIQTLVTTLTSRDSWKIMKCKIGKYFRNLVGLYFWLSHIPYIKMNSSFYLSSCQV